MFDPQSIYPYYLNNVLESAGSSCFLPITSLQLGIQWLDSKDKKTKAIKELKWEAGEASEEQHKPIELSPGKSHRQHFELNPASEDVGKKLVAHHVILSLGNDGSDTGSSGSLTMLLDIRLPCEEAILETLAESDFSTIKCKLLSLYLGLAFFEKFQQNSKIFGRIKKLVKP